MIYPSMQSINTLGEAKGSFNIAVDGFEAAYAAGFLSEFSLNICKADKLYITIIRKNDRSTEYIEEACRLTDEKYFIDTSETDGNVHMRLTVSGKKSLFRALCRVRQMLRCGEVPLGSIEDYPLFAERGYIEGFYGSPWSFETRKSTLKMMAEYGMNTYYYAPKDDPYHREKWSELYPETELAELKELADIGRENFVDIYYCIAPGLSICYSSDEDFELLKCKVEQLYSIGIRNFGLLLDDIPDNLFYEEDKQRFGNDTANAHIYIINRFNAFLKELDPKSRLTVCPLVYHGSGEEYYISKLGRGIDGDVSLFWTGKNICSQELTVPEAVIFTHSTARRPLYWDNFPVNDAEMYNELHIGYLSGRESGLYRFAEGLISNVMPYPLSSRIPLLTVCDYLWAPTKYDGVASWQKTCEIVFDDKKEALMPFVENLLTSCLKVENSPGLNSAIAAANQELFSGNRQRAQQILLAYANKMKGALTALDPNDPLRLEAEPWLNKYAVACELFESAAMLLSDSSQEQKNKVADLLSRYMVDPRTLCDFSLQEFSERMLSL